MNIIFNVKTIFFCLLSFFTINKLLFFIYFKYLPTDYFRRYFTESCQTITSHAINTDEIYPSVIQYRRNYRQIISVGISQRVGKQLPAMPYLPTDMPSVITIEIADGFIPSVMFPRETFFLARAYPSVRPSVFRWWVFFLFATDLATEMGVTDD